MTGIHWTEWLILLATAGASALLAVWIVLPRKFRALTRRGAAKPAPSATPDDPGHFAAAGAWGGAVFLFDGVEMVDAADPAGMVLKDGETGLDWTTLRARLEQSHPDFPEAPETVRRAGKLVVERSNALQEDDDGKAADAVPGGAVECEWVDGMLRVALKADSAPKPDIVPAVQPSGNAPDFLRDTLDSAPYPIWRADGDGTVTWANAAYIRLAHRLHGAGADALQTLFPDLSETCRSGRKTRVSIAGPEGGNRLWYDVSMVRQPGADLFYAVDINAVVDAEIAQRNFVQTLAKTFAQLSIGLAIFDRNRQLALFNPALVELTELPADFLSARPNLFTFFDRLRDQRMMPEPKNYRSWRHQMSDLAAAAADGRYQETWSLPSGSVYSVSGRPHPDGAVAFLFEDITAEITLTRRFRSELELGQAILDRVDDAIAVFSPDGALAFSNAAHNHLWGIDPEASFAQVTIQETARSWQENCLATPIWGRIRDFAELRSSRREWSAQVVMRSGERLICTVSPIQNGATMVRFSPAAQPETTGAEGPAGLKTAHG